MKNGYWLLFLGVMFLGILLYSGKWVYHVWSYIRLDKQAGVEDIQWSVLPLNDEKFILVADYQFKDGGKLTPGHSQWSQSFLNGWAAQEQIKRLSSAPLMIWYDAGHPEYSSLEKRFPLKEGFYALILWLLGLYFVGLGRYVKSWNSS